jgi:lysyl-tRNA synthetase class 2
MAESERDLRVKKLDALRALGVEPFGNRFDGAQPVREILARWTPETDHAVEVCAAGRLTVIRGHGKAAFADLRDDTGKIQVYFRQDALDERSFALFKLLDFGDLVGVRGALFKTRTGEITVQVKALTLLAKSLLPLPEKWHGLKDAEIRHRQRYLDLIATPDALKTFLARSRVIAQLRRFLDERGYVEVETPVMQRIPGGAAARPFVTHHNALDMDLYLRIALEIPLKKLLVGGIPRVYEIGRVFRNEGVDSHHNPEFTLLELYHAWGDLHTMMELVESLIARLAREIAGGTTLAVGGKTLDVTPPWPRREYLDLLREHVGVDPNDDDALRAKLRARNIEPGTMPHIDLLDKVFGECVEPILQNATFVCNQPIEMTPLCREVAGRPGIADRFEAFLGGMEIANAYTELNDPLEQRRRLVAQSGGAGDEMVQSGKIDEDFLTALEHGMPPAGGLGIGIDRLVMLLTGQESIREVILFPLLRSREGE